MMYYIYLPPHIAKHYKPYVMVILVFNQIIIDCKILARDNF